MLEALKPRLFLALLVGVMVFTLVVSGVPPFGQISEVRAASTTARYPGTVVSTSASPYVNETWTTPANAGVDDGAYAYVDTNTFDSGIYTYRLDATNFSFAIPTSATIDGIVIEIEQNGAKSRDDLVQLIKGGTPQGNNLSANATVPTSDTIITFGSSTDLWGLTWTVADINASNFGVAYAAMATGNNGDIYIDFVRITVYYTPLPDISNTPNSYAFGAVGTSDTKVTGLAYFTLTNNSLYSVNITIGASDMTGGVTPWTLSDTATAGADTYGLNAGLDGADYTTIVKKNGPFNTIISGLVASGNQSWGLQLLAPTSFSDSNTKSGTVTLTATQA
jgi:hypothetical protein